MPTRPPSGHCAGCPHHRRSLLVPGGDETGEAKEAGRSARHACAHPRALDGQPPALALVLADRYLGATDATPAWCPAAP